MEKAPEQIKEWAATNGLKLKWLADQVPVGPSQLSRWINRVVVPIQIYRVRLAEITGLDVSDESSWEDDQ